MCCGEEMHGHHARHAINGAHHGGMIHGICGCGFEGRRFLSKREKMELLEEYREALRNELEGVEEELKTLKKEA